MALVEIILKKKIEGLGVEADLVKVKGGYARNYLFPKRLATPANSATKRQVEELHRQRALREAEELNQAQELAKKLSKLTLKFTLTAGTAQGKVFGSVTSQAIADKVKENGYEIDRRKIHLEKPIKETGSHEVRVDLGSQVEGKLKLKIESATAEEQKEKKK